MKCPFCSHSETKVIDKRVSDDKANRRRRECLKCRKRFTTYEKIEHLITKVKKRDGRIVNFDQNKITEAIWKAAQSVGGTDRDIAESLCSKVVETLEEKFGGVTVPTVEQIQDIVEKTLVENGHYKTAKAYILYRKQHEKIRETKTLMVDVTNTIGEYLNQTDWRVKENANEAFSFSGLLLHTAGKVMSNYNLNELYSAEISNAHKQGYIHIHDLSHGVIGYCCGHSLKNLLLWGFGGVPNKVDCKPAKHLSTVVHQMVNYIGCLQMEFAGAEAFSSCDTLLAPFVKADKLNYKQVKQNMQQLVFSLNIPSRWGAQFPFSNVTFDWVAPEDMKDEKAIVGGKSQDFTYGDCQPEMDMINKAFIEVMLEGDANGGVFSFPIPTYNLTKDFNWNSKNAKFLFEMTAKYGLPYFQNYIGSGLDPKSLRAMCCRLNLNMKELMQRPGNMWGPGDSSISGDTPVYVNVDGNWRLKQISYVHKEKLRNFKTLSFNPLTSGIEEASVRSCIKHGIRDVFKLKTNQGTIKITEDHCMFNVSDGGDIVNATLEDVRERGYFIAPKLHMVGSMYKLNIAEELIKNGFTDKMARVLLKDELLFNRIISSEEAKAYIKKNYKNKFTDVKSKWKHSNFGRPTIAFDLFKILYKKDLIKQSDLKDMLVCKIKHKLPLVIDLNYDTGLIAGLFLAEGFVHEACLVCNNDEKILKKCADAAKKIFGCKPAVYIQKPGNKKVGSVTFNSQFVAKYLNFGLGLSGHSNTKRVPVYIHNSNPDTIKGLIDGYYLGDGHKSKDYIELTTVSKEIAEGIILSLKRIGSRFALKEYKRPRKNRKKSYDVRVFSYRGKVVSIDRKYGKDIRHLLGIFRNGVAELKKNISTKKAIELGLPQPFYNMHYTPRENNVIKGFEILKKNNLMNGYFDTVLRFLESYERVDVLGIKYSGKETVYDLSVPGHENFVAGNGMFFTHNTGSIGVMTINVNRLAYEARKESKSDEEARTLYFNKLGYYMTLCKNALEIKRRVIEKNMKNGLMPFTKRYLGTFRNHFSTIGLCGMNEACLNLLGRDISGPEGKKIAIDTLLFMRDKCLEFQKETGNLYNLEATPAESSSYRLAREDKKMYPDIITAGKKEPYLTNSTQLPVDKTDDVIEAIEHQNDIQPLYTGGTIFHVFLGESMSSGEGCKQLVKKIAENTKLPYFSITPTFSRCPEHGYIKGEHFKCPQPNGGNGKSVCGKRCEVYSRVVGYFRPVQIWNNGKQEEFKDRKEFLEKKALAGRFKAEAA